MIVLMAAYFYVACDADVVAIGHAGYMEYRQIHGRMLQGAVSWHCVVSA